MSLIHVTIITETLSEDLMYTVILKTFLNIMFNIHKQSPFITQPSDDGPIGLKDVRQF
jgi:hypothetical protein